jgi:hypothetical protein
MVSTVPSIPIFTLAGVQSASVAWAWSRIVWAPTGTKRWFQPSSGSKDTRQVSVAAP